MFSKDIFVYAKLFKHANINFIPTVQNFAFYFKRNNNFLEAKKQHNYFFLYLIYKFVLFIHNIIIKALKSVMLLEAIVGTIIIVLIENVLAKRYTPRIRKDLKKVYSDWGGIDRVNIFKI